MRTPAEFDMIEGLHSQETQCSFRRKIWDRKKKLPFSLHLILLLWRNTPLLFIFSVSSHHHCLILHRKLKPCSYHYLHHILALPLSTGHPVTVGSVVPFYILLQKIMLMSFSLCTAPLTFFWPIDLVLVSLISIRQAETVAGLGEAHSESRDGHIGPRPHPIRKV